MKRAPNKSAFAAGGDYRKQPGMTMREYYAGEALRGMGAWCPQPDDSVYLDLNSDAALEARADWACRQADALMRRLERDRL